MKFLFVYDFTWFVVFPSNTTCRATTITFLKKFLICNVNNSPCGWGGGTLNANVSGSLELT